jgi:hypothetical protein
MKPKFALKERYVIEDGIARIRPIENGRPGPTVKEVDEAVAKFNAVMAEQWTDHPKQPGKQRAINPITYERMERDTPGWDANGSPAA